MTLLPRLVHWQLLQTLPQKTLAQLLKTTVDASLLTALADALAHTQPLDILVHSTNPWLALHCADKLETLFSFDHCAATALLNKLASQVAADSTVIPALTLLINCLILAKATLSVQSVEYLGQIAALDVDTTTTTIRLAQLDPSTAALQWPQYSRDSKYPPNLKIPLSEFIERQMCVLACSALMLLARCAPQSISHKAHLVWPPCIQRRFRLMHVICLSCIYSVQPSKPSRSNVHALDTWTLLLDAIPYVADMRDIEFDTRLVLIRKLSRCQRVFLASLSESPLAQYLQTTHPALVCYISAKWISGCPEARLICLTLLCEWFPLSRLEETMQRQIVEYCQEADTPLTRRVLERVRDHVDPSGLVESGHGICPEDRQMSIKKLCGVFVEL